MYWKPPELEFKKNVLDLKPDSPKEEHRHCMRNSVENLKAGHSNSAYPKLQFLFPSWHSSNLVKLCLDHRNLPDKQTNKWTGLTSPDHPQNLQKIFSVNFHYSTSYNQQFRFSQAHVSYLINNTKEEFSIFNCVESSSELYWFCFIFLSDRF